MKKLINNLENKLPHPLLIVLLCYIGWVCILHLFIQPFLKIDDAFGLWVILSAMKDFGIIHCINTNWGFALPLSVYTLTEVTKDAQISVIILSTLSGGGILLAAYLMLNKVLLVNSKLYLSTILGLLIFSVEYQELLLTVHLDIVPIACFLLGLYFLYRAEEKQYAIFAAILIGFGYWFRFHYLVLSLLLPIITIFLHPNQRTIWYKVAITTFIMAIIPHILTYYTFGVSSLSNQKTVLLQAAFLNNWNCDFQHAVKTRDYAELISLLSIHNFIDILNQNLRKDGQVPLFLITALTFIFSTSSIKNILPTSKDRRFIWLIFVWITISAVPFMAMRWHCPRMMAMINIPFYILLASLVYKDYQKYLALLLVICLLKIETSRHYLHFEKVSRNERLSTQKIIEKHKKDFVFEGEQQNIYIYPNLYVDNEKPYLTHTIEVNGWICQSDFLYGVYPQSPSSKEDWSEKSRKYKFLYVERYQYNKYLEKKNFKIIEQDKNTLLLEVIK